MKKISLVVRLGFAFGSLLLMTAVSAEPTLEQRVKSLEDRVQQPIQQTAFPTIKPLSIGMPVYVASYMDGINPRYNISNLIINVSDVNRDYHFLQRRQGIVTSLAEKNLSPPARPIVALSGELQGRVIATRPYRGATTSDINLSAAKFDVLVDAGHGVMAFMSMHFDRSGNSAGARIANSRFFLDNGFITFGDLCHTDFYGTIGQLYVPFGRYTSSMISDTLPLALGEMNERAIVLGYQRQGVHAPFVHLFVAAGDIRVETATRKINQSGLDLGYHYKQGSTNFLIGSSYVENLADAQGMQATGGSTAFKGFGVSSSTEILEHRVPGLSIYSQWSWGRYRLIGEVVTATRNFAAGDLTFNGRPAKPCAFHLEGSVHFNAGSEPISLALSYGRSYEALGLNVPETRYMITVSREVLSNTVLSLELLHDINYGRSDTATGQSLAATGTTVGESRSAARIQVTVYF